MTTMCKIYMTQQLLLQLLCFINAAAIVFRIYELYSWSKIREIWKRDPRSMVTHIYLGYNFKGYIYQIADTIKKI